MKKTIFFTIVVGFAVCFVAPVFGQQESQYTQFMNNKLYYNPSVAGMDGNLKFTGLFRRQWMGFDDGPQSTLASASLPLMGERIGMGLIASLHELGVTRNWYLSMSYSYNLKIDDRSNLRLGINGTMRRLSLDFSKSDLVIRDRLDESILQGNESGDYYGNFGFGLYYQYDDYYVGFSIPNAVENNIDLADGINLDKFAQESRHYYFMAGGSFVANPKIDIQPHMLMKYVENAPFDLDLNVSMLYDKRILGGLSYRAGGDSGAESIDLLFGYKLENQLMLMVSYDIGMSELARETSGTIEFSVQYDVIRKKSGDVKEEMKDL